MSFPSDQPKSEDANDVVVDFETARARLRSSVLVAATGSEPEAKKTESLLATMDEFVRLGEKARSISEEIANFRARRRT